MFTKLTIFVKFPFYFEVILHLGCCYYIRFKLPDLIVRYSVITVTFNYASPEEVMISYRYSVVGFQQCQLLFPTLQPIEFSY